MGSGMPHFPLDASRLKKISPNCMFQAGSAHGLSFKNRKQRMQEYAVRRREIMGPVEGTSNICDAVHMGIKRRRVLSGLPFAPTYTFSGDLQTAELLAEQVQMPDTVFVLGNGSDSGLRRAG